MIKEQKIFNNILSINLWKGEIWVISNCFWIWIKKDIKGNNDEHINIFKKSEILSIISYLINYFQN